MSVDSGINSEKNILQNVIYQNLTNKGFFIQKAEIELSYPKGKEKFISNIRFEKPDRYLISFRNRMGIEGARIYVNNDTVLINDRINKKLYFATTLYLIKKYGFTQNLLPLIFGDIILDKNCETSVISCAENRIEIECSVSGIVLDYNIDCGEKKTIMVHEKEEFINNGFKISYGGYFVDGDIRIPRRVTLENPQTGIIIKMKILKIDSSWSGSIKFIPGKGYDIIELV